MPQPVAQANAPFFVWEALTSPFVVATAVGLIEPAGQFINVDSKSMRKVGVNEQVRLVVQNNAGAAGGIFSMFGRILVKLH